jgi:hypothetical protein
MGGSATKVEEPPVTFDKDGKQLGRSEIDLCQMLRMLGWHFHFDTLALSISLCLKSFVAGTRESGCAVLVLTQKRSEMSV